jgi:hypothetical protein
VTYFSVEQAEKLIPELEKIYAAVQSYQTRVERKHRELASLDSENPPAADVAILRSQLDFLVEGLQGWLARIEQLGCVAKGLDPFLVDFPHRLGGLEVYLCWKQGEKAILNYHGLEEGFSGRKPLPARARK